MNTKDRSKFTHEELIAEIQYFEKDNEQLRKDVSNAFNEGVLSGQQELTMLVRPLYKACFGPKGWIGFINLGCKEVGTPLLTLLAHFHSTFNRKG